MKSTYRQHGEMFHNHNLVKYLCSVLALWQPLQAQAIYVGNLTFSMPADKSMVTKYIVNNNKEARLYRVLLRAIDKPGEHEVNSRPADGELLYAPRQIMLQAGEGDFFKFHYFGPKDGKERYYRASFQEIPTQNRVMKRSSESQVSLMPVIVMQTILVVRPRNVNFKWAYDRPTGLIKNTGNTWFKLILKPDCNATEDESDIWYLRPGDSLRKASVSQAQNILLIYNEQFIKVTDTCR